MVLVADHNSKAQSQPSMSNEQSAISDSGQEEGIDESLDSQPRAPEARAKKNSRSAMKANSKPDSRNSKPDLEILARRQVLEDLAWAVLTSKEFLFNH
jgi:hypothetical protein